MIGAATRGLSVARRLAKLGTAGARVAGRRTGSVTGLTGEVYRQAPIATGIVGAGLGVSAADLAAEFGQGVFTDREINNLLAAERARRGAMRTVDRFQANIERMKRANLQRLAAAHPQVYNAVAAGQELPDEAVVLGGEPRVDLLDTLAQMMVDGRIPAINDNQEA